MSYTLNNQTYTDFKEFQKAYQLDYKQKHLNDLKTYHNDYYQDNKTKMDSYQKQYVDTNREQCRVSRRKYNNTKFVCECGKTVSLGHRAAHIRTKTHLIKI